MAYEIIRNDITREKADAIVTLPHRTPEVGSGVDKAVHEKAGLRLIEARKALVVIEPGDAWATSAYGLDAKWVIHALGPIRGKDDANEHQLLQSWAVIAMRAGEGYSYLKNLRSKNCTVNPCRERVIRLAKAIDATPNETDLLLRTAGHAA